MKRAFRGIFPVCGILLCILSFSYFIPALKSFMISAAYAGEQEEKAMIAEAKKSAVLVFSYEKTARGWRQTSKGSGVLISNDGLVVTNEHVVGISYTFFKELTQYEWAFEKLYDFAILLPNGKRVKAQLVSVSPFDDDLALLQIIYPPEDITPITQETHDVEVGSHVWAIGGPFSLGINVTRGIISQLNVLGYLSVPLLTTDAAINPGNSGGPVVNASGELVGISQSILSRSGGFDGIGFIIPAKVILHFLKEYIENLPSDGRLGIFIEQLDRSNISNEEQWELPDHKNSSDIVVTEILPGSAAEEYLRVGDIIITVNERVFPELWEFSRFIANQGAGAMVQLVVWRDGTIKTITIEIGGIPELSEEYYEEEEVFR